MWNQTTIEHFGTVADLKESMNNKPKVPVPKNTPFVVYVQEMDRKVVKKINAISFCLGILFLIAFLLLVMNGKIRLSGSYVPSMTLFHQRLEFVLRYQALSLSVIAINVLMVYIRRFMRSQTDDTEDEVMKRLTDPLNDSLQQFLMSTIIQMVLAANLEPQQVMAFSPYMAITFFIGRVVYLATYPKYHYFGCALSSVPTLVAVLFNVFTVRFIFH